MDLFQIYLQEGALDLELELITHVSDFCEEILHSSGDDASLLFNPWIASLR